MSHARTNEVPGAAVRRGVLLSSLLGAALLAPLGASHAEVKYADPDSSAMEFTEVIKAPVSRVYQGLGEVGHWWNGEHSWSGDAKNLSLPLEAGACFCERWGHSSVLHGTVIMAQADSLLRLEAPLGPLQGRALKAILTFELKAVGDTTELHTTYLINGTHRSQLDASAAPVNEVLGEQLVRLKSYLETGHP